MTGCVERGQCWSSNRCQLSESEKRFRCARSLRNPHQFLGRVIAVFPMSKEPRRENTTSLGQVCIIRILAGSEAHCSEKGTTGLHERLRWLAAIQKHKMEGEAIVGRNSRRTKGLTAKGCGVHRAGWVWFAVGLATLTCFYEYLQEHLEAVSCPHSLRPRHSWWKLHHI